LTAAQIPTVPAKTGYTGVWNPDPTTAVITANTTFTAVYTPISTAAEKMNITYENITNPGQAIANGDLFYAVFKLTGVTDSVAVGSFTANYDKNVVQLAKTDGTVPANFGQCSNSPITDMTIDDSDNSGYSGNAFEASGYSVDTTNGSVSYAFSSKIYDGTNYYAYPLTAADKANGMIYVKVRFKALAAGNANFSFVNGDTKMRHTFLGQDIYPTAVITPLTIGGVVTTHSVTFMADGKQVGSTLTVNDGATLTAAQIPAVPAKTGYTGVWNLDPTTVVITANTTFTAVYTAIPPTTHSVTFMADGTQVGSILTVNDGAILTAAQIPTVPAKTGYTGVWNPDPTTAVIAANTTFTAVYTAISSTTYSVTFMADGT
jgi:hypothetical protein